MSGHEDHIIQLIEERGEVAQLEDGFHHFFPHGDHGCWNTHGLRVIAEHLEELNQPLRDELEAAWRMETREDETEDGEAR